MFHASIYSNSLQHLKFGVEISAIILYPVFVLEGPKIECLRALVGLF